MGNRPLHRLQGGRSRNLLEFKHGRAAEDGVEHIKIGIFRGGGNQGDLSVFDVFQQGLLLFFVKGLNLVQIQQHPVGCHKGVQLGHNLFDVRSGSGGGIELIQRAVGLLGNDVGNSGLACAAGAIVNHVGNVAGVNQAAQHRALAQNMFLSKYFVQRLWPKQIR